MAKIDLGISQEEWDAIVPSPSFMSESEVADIMKQEACGKLIEAARIKAHVAPILSLDAARLKVQAEALLSDADELKRR